ncbi:MAG: hypothetical protein DMG51_09880 [Acidobacteria bacterium]|nr:MAG: hypothetical protein DMG51_09880 [Acidobacteriota bacterium]
MQSNGKPQVGGRAVVGWRTARLAERDRSEAPAKTAQIGSVVQTSPGIYRSDHRRRPPKWSMPNRFWGP